MEQRVAVLISANVEWRAVCALFPQAARQVYPYGEWFDHPYEIESGRYIPARFSMAAGGRYRPQPQLSM